MDLLIDVGNSRIKWAQCTAAGLSAHGDVPLAALGGGGIDAWQVLPRPERILVANVAGVRVAEQLTEQARRQWQREAHFVTTPAAAFGVTNAYRRPDQMGVDRWLVLVAGWRIVGGPVCVADLGTAVTVDAVAANGRHAGGLIAAGRALMIEALLSRTGELRRKHAEPVKAGAGLLAADTHTAIERAALYAVAALIDRVMVELQQQYGHAPRLLLTGGDAAAVASAIRSRSELCPDLVLQGLALYARESE